MDLIIIQQNLIGTRYCPNYNITTLSICKLLQFFISVQPTDWNYDFLRKKNIAHSLATETPRHKTTAN
jgi:hypothetical protein